MSEEEEGLLYGGEGKQGQINSSRSNDLLKAQWFGRFRNLSKTTYQVWFGMQAFQSRKNYVNARLRQIAEFCGLSVSTVQRAMHDLEEHNVVVRMSRPHGRSIWMINPELQWNWNRHQFDQGVAVYQQAREKTLNAKKMMKIKEKRVNLSEKKHTIASIKTPWCRQENQDAREDRGHCQRTANSGSLVRPVSACS